MQLGGISALPTPLFILLLSISFFLGIPTAFAQTTPGQSFVWGFIGTSDGVTSFPQCGASKLHAEPLSASPVPPFYIIAFAVGLPPITTLVGSDASALQWTTEHPAGSQLLLEMVDSQGNSGGIGQTLYTVQAGSTACAPPASSGSAFTISANISTGSVVNTCEPWGLSITGGTPPYKVTIAALNTAFVTNVTMGVKDDMFTYINRMGANGQMIATVSDSTGRWATGSPFVHTAGSANTDCGSLVSTSWSSKADSQPSSVDTTPPPTVVVAPHNPANTESAASQSHSQPGTSASESSSAHSSGIESGSGATVTVVSTAGASLSGTTIISNSNPGASPAVLATGLSSSAKIGIIAGGAVVALALIVAVVLLLHCRRRSARTANKRSSTHHENGSVEPFVRFSSSAHSSMVLSDTTPTASGNPFLASMEKCSSSNSNPGSRSASPFIQVHGHDYAGMSRPLPPPPPSQPTYVPGRNVHTHSGDFEIGADVDFPPPYRTQASA